MGGVGAANLKAFFLFPDGRAQVSIEGFVAVGVLAIVLAAVYFQLGAQQPQINYLGSSVLQANDCASLQSAVAAVQSSGFNAQAEIATSSDADISANIVRFSGSYCYIATGNGINAHLNAGNVRVKYVNGAVSVENF